MIFVPFAWASSDNSGIQRILDDLGPERKFCALVASGADAGFAILKNTDDSITDYDQFEPGTMEMLYPDGSIRQLPGGLNLEEGYFAASVDYFPEGSFRFATQRY